MAAAVAWAKTPGPRPSGQYGPPTLWSRRSRAAADRLLRGSFLAAAIPVQPFLRKPQVGEVAVDGVSEGGERPGVVGPDRRGVETGPGRLVWPSEMTWGSARPNAFWKGPEAAMSSAGTLDGSLLVLTAIYWPMPWTNDRNRSVT
jgi:hypothetical protein